MRMNIVPEGGPTGKLKAPANPIGFYNPAEKAALNLQRKKGTGSAMVSDLKKTPGVNDERLTELGLGDLASRPEVTREELLAATQENRIPLRESVKRELDKEAINELEEEYQDLANQFAAVSGQGNPEEVMRISAALDKNLAEQNRLKSLPEARFGPATSPDYSLPGGENYREIRVSLPSNKRPMSYEDWRKSGSSEEWSSKGIVGEDFMHQTHHGDEPNVLFHLRVADHVDAEGKKGLLIDELQSDWHQQGAKKGYGPKYEDRYRAYYDTPTGQVDIGFGKTQEEVNRMVKASGWEGMPVKIKTEKTTAKVGQGVPDAPFKENWYQLGLKRAIKEAADTGMDRVYLTTGNRQALRYSEDQRKGMEQWYDKTYKNFLDKYAKQFGARVGETKIPSTNIMEHWPEFRDWFAQKYGDRGSALAAHSQWSQGRNNKNVREFEKQFPKEYEPVYYIDITPKMRDSAKIGQSYKDGGAVHMAEGGAVDYEAAFNKMLQDHVGMAQGGAVDYESSFNEMLQRHVQGMAEGGQVNTYDSSPDMSDGGRFIPAPAFADGGAVKSIWTVN
jgi:hypothetical protein